MKIVFMGTPDFSVRILEEISKKHEVVLVVTQPDVYNSKKKQYLAPPVKKWAIEHNIDVFQPEKISKDYNRILELDIDLIVTAAYGQFIPMKLINHPKYRAINVHGSILPKYRGGAPIQRAIINGDKETGITIIYMEKGMDSGNMLRIDKIPILEEDNQDTIFKKLSVLGSSIINNVIEKLPYNPPSIKQNEEEVVFAYNLTKEDEFIDYRKSAREVFNQIRGLCSNPGGYFILDDVVIKVYDSIESGYKKEGLPGQIVKINKNSFDVLCGDGYAISILEIQMPSKNRMSAKDFINGSGRKLLQIGKIIEVK